LDTDGTTGLEFTLQSTEPEAHTFSTRLGVHDYTGPQPIPIGFGNSASGRFASDTMVIAGSYGPGQWAITLTYEATTLAGGGSCWAAATATYD
jgi:hypothetical protein